VANCEAYASLRSLKLLKGAEDFAKFGLPTLADLPKGHSFGEALSALIDAAARGEVFKVPGGKPNSLNTFFEVRFIGPSPRAEILVDGTKDFGLSAKLSYLKILTKAGSQKKLPTKTDSRNSPDLRRTNTVSFRTIQTLGSLISGEWNSSK
jgi:hypothetical protein